MACYVSQSERDSPERDEGSGSSPDIATRRFAEKRFNCTLRRGSAHGTSALSLEV